MSDATTPRGSPASVHETSRLQDEPQAAHFCGTAQNA